MKSKVSLLSLCAILSGALFQTGCSSQEIPPAHKGRLFDKTGVVALYVGGDGFKGPVLNPGTHYTGLYPEIRMVDCSQKTIKESLSALTKDGVQFNLDVYITFSASCDSEDSTKAILEKITPSPHKSAPSEKEHEKTEDQTEDVPYPDLTVTSNQLYRLYVRPAIGEAVRESVSPFIANDVNGKRDEIFDKIKTQFNSLIAKQSPALVNIISLNLSNLDFPDAMDTANSERAAQAILKDKAIAEREKVSAEIETAKLKITQEEVLAQASARRIDVMGEAYKRNPEMYMISLYEAAGSRGNMFMLPNDPHTMLMLPQKKESK